MTTEDPRLTPQVLERGGMKGLNKPHPPETCLSLKVFINQLLPLLYERLLNARAGFLHQ